MITGDNPLTACHVAKELHIATKKMLVLQPPQFTVCSDAVWRWESISGGTVHQLEKNRQAIRHLGSAYDFTLTGDVSLCYNVIYY